MQLLDDESKNLWEEFRNTHRGWHIGDDLIPHGDHAQLIYSEILVDPPLKPRIRHKHIADIVGGMHINYSDIAMIYRSFIRKGSPLTDDEVQKLIGDSK